jgi:hypothetical protein
VGIACTRRGMASVYSCLLYGVSQVSSTLVSRGRPSLAQGTSMVRGSGGRDPFSSRHLYKSLANESTNTANKNARMLLIQMNNVMMRGMTEQRFG